MTAIDRAALRYALAVALLGLVAWCCQPRAGAMDDPTAPAIAALLVHEAQGSRPDWRAMMLALEDRAERGGWPELEAARRYSGGRLRAVLRAPRVRRSRHRAEAEAVVRRWLAGAPVDNPCDGPVSHWGSPDHPVDTARADRAIRAGRWVELDCPGTRQRYFRLR